MPNEDILKSKEHRSNVNTDKKKILLIGTGGTIASVKTEDGLLPGISPKGLLDFIPSVNNVADISFHQLFNLDSTNMGPYHWQEIVKYIESVYKDYDGFVISHGTDTMAYTAAALSYMIQNSTKPIVLTGSQKPINFDITDAKSNLLDAILYASDSNSRGVVLVFAGLVIAGTRAKKIRSKSYSAFSSIDFPALAIIQEGKIMRYLPVIEFVKPVEFHTEINSKVFLLKLIPGMKSDMLRYLFEEYDGLIFESFGLGGIPSSISDEFIKLCSEYPNKLVIMTTQVAHEGSDMNIYEVGLKFKKELDFLESYDMTPEAILAKAMYVLADKNMSKEKLKEAFYTPINYDSICFAQGFQNF